MNNEEDNIIICPFCESMVDISSIINYEKIKCFEDIDKDNIECMCNYCNYIFFKKEGEDND